MNQLNSIKQRKTINLNEEHQKMLQLYKKDKSCEDKYLNFNTSSYGETIDTVTMLDSARKAPSKIDHDQLLTMERIVNETNDNEKIAIIIEDHEIKKDSKAEETPTENIEKDNDLEDVNTSDYENNTTQVIFENSLFQKEKKKKRKKNRTHF